MPSDPENNFFLGTFHIKKYCIDLGKPTGIYWENIGKWPETWWENWSENDQKLDE